MVRHTGEDFINVEGVAKASMLSFQSSGVESTEFYAPEADRFAANSDPSFGEQIFNIAMAEVESIVEPDYIADDIRWEPVAFVCSHRQIISRPR